MNDRQVSSQVQDDSPTERPSRGDTPLAVEFERVNKDYGRVKAVEQLSLSVPQGEFVTLLGPSGSGKTTLLKLLAGFETLSGGRILLSGDDVSSLRPARRNIGMVFQHYALFPHMTVHQNIEYGLRMRGWNRSRRSARVAEVLELVSLQGYADRRPNQLSGGQQQRVALARAVAFGPSVLLMDEPLGALDRALRLYVAAELRRIHRELGTTIVYVTHDQEEALALSDRIVIMRAGSIVSSGTPEKLYREPPTSFVATFFAAHNLFPAERVPMGPDDDFHVRINDQVHDDLPRGREISSDEDIRVAIRPQSLRLTPCEHGCLSFDVVVEESIFAGEATQLMCSMPGVPRLIAAVDIPKHDQFDVGTRTQLYCCSQDAIVVPFDGVA